VRPTGLTVVELVQSENWYQYFVSAFRPVTAGLIGYRFQTIVVSLTLNLGDHT
jgi:hypothetical protein